MVRTRLLLALLVILATVVAGCNVDTDDEVETSSVTPAPVPEGELDGISPPFPPGVTNQGLVAPGELLDAHTLSVTNTSYTAGRERVERWADGTVRAHTTVGVRRGVQGQYHAVVNSTSTLADRTEFWADGDRVVLASTLDNDTRYSPAYTGHGSQPLAEDILYFGSAPYRGGVASQRRLFEYLLLADGSDVEVLQPTGGADRFRYRFTAAMQRAARQFSAAEGFDRVTNLSFQLVVDERGIVRSYDLAYTGHTDDRTVAVRESVRYTDVGTTTVSSPAWAPRADSTPANDREPRVRGAASSE